MKITLLNSGDIQVVKLPQTPETQAIYDEMSKLAWCECDNGEPKIGENDLFADDGTCNCGMQKHHYHCRTCLGLTQIG